MAACCKDDNEHTQLMTCSLITLRVWFNVFLLAAIHHVQCIGFSRNTIAHNLFLPCLIIINVCKEHEIYTAKLRANLQIDWTTEMDVMVKTLRFEMGFRGKSHTKNSLHRCSAHPGVILFRWLGRYMLEDITFLLVFVVIVVALVSAMGNCSSIGFK